MVWILRISLLLLFALHWGGLTFYTGFVVRISHDVLSDPMDGGLITQRVTAVLQVLGALVLVVMAINGIHVAAHSRRIGFALLGCVCILAAALVGLSLVHSQLDAVIDIDQFGVTDREAFALGHRRYNQLTTIQWITSLAYLPITVIAWRRIDLGVGRVRRE